MFHQLLFAKHRHELVCNEMITTTENLHRILDDDTKIRSAVSLLHYFSKNRFRPCSLKQGCLNLNLRLSRLFFAKGRVSGFFLNGIDLFVRCLVFYINYISSILLFQFNWFLSNTYELVLLPRMSWNEVVYTHALGYFSIPLAHPINDCQMTGALRPVFYLLFLSDLAIVTFSALSAKHSAFIGSWIQKPSCYLHL